MKRINPETIRKVVYNAVRETLRSNPMPRGAVCSTKKLKEMKEERISAKEHRIERLKEIIERDRELGKDTSLWEEMLMEQLES